VGAIRQREGRTRAHREGERAALGRKNGWTSEQGVGCGSDRAKKGREKEWFKRKGFLFFKRIQTMNSNQSLNSNTTK
jgi:hypothetical protein